MNFPSAWAYTPGLFPPAPPQQTIPMTLEFDPTDLSRNARTLLAAIRKAGVDLSAEPGTQGKLWRALAAGASGRLTAESLAEISSRKEMDAEKDAVAARFDTTGKQRPSDLGFLLLGLFCASPAEAFDVAEDVLALLNEKNFRRLG